MLLEGPNRVPGAGVLHSDAGVSFNLRGYPAVLGTGTSVGDKRVNGRCEGIEELLIPRGSFIFMRGKGYDGVRTFPGVSGAPFTVCVDSVEAVKALLGACVDEISARGDDLSAAALRRARFLSSDEPDAGPRGDSGEGLDCLIARASSIFFFSSLILALVWLGIVPGDLGGIGLPLSLGSPEASASRRSFERGSSRRSALFEDRERWARGRCDDLLEELRRAGGAVMSRANRQGVVPPHLTKECPQTILRRL